MRPFLILIYILWAGFTFCAFGQLKQTKHFSSQNGLCSQSIILDSNGYFFHEWGCEGRSNISFGRYKIGRNNILMFQFLPFDSLMPIKNIVEIEPTEQSDTLIAITFYDRFGKTLNTNFGIRVADTANKVHEMWTDEKGQIQLNRFVYKNIILIQFLTIYGEAAGIPLENNSLNVYVNLPRVFLDYPELSLDKPQKLDLQIKQNGLFNPKSNKVVYKLD